MKNRREHGQIKMYDYTNKQEFDKHKVQMRKRGWHLIEGIFGGALDHQEMNDENWKYTACYLKSDMY